MWLELALARKEVEGEAKQVAGTDLRHSVGLWKYLDVGFISLFRDFGFYFL